MSDAVERVLDVLMGSESMGAETDNPEGARYIQISEKLAMSLIDDLLTYLEDRWSDGIDAMGEDA